MLFYAILVSAIGIIVFTFFKDKPPTPPSFTATLKREKFIQAAKDLLKNKSYLLLLLTASLVFGCFTGGLVVSVAFYVQPFGFTQQVKLFI